MCHEPPRAGSPIYIFMDCRSHNCKRLYPYRDCIVIVLLCFSSFKLIEMEMVMPKVLVAKDPCSGRSRLCLIISLQPSLSVGDDPLSSHPAFSSLFFVFDIFISRGEFKVLVNGTTTTYYRATILCSGGRISLPWNLHCLQSCWTVSLCKKAAIIQSCRGAEIFSLVLKH